MKYFKTFESFVNEQDDLLNEAAEVGQVREYFPNANNPGEYIADKITSYGEKVAISNVISDMRKELKVKDSDKKLFGDAIKNYVKNFDTTGKLRKTLNMNESEELNEGTAWFPGETIDDRINDDSSDWNKFWKGAKVGDTFQSSPDGAELNYCKTSDINQGKKKITISTTTIGHNYGTKQDKEGALCTIVDRKKVQWIGSDYDESDKIDTIFYTVRGEPGYNVYMLGEM